MKPIQKSLFVLGLVILALAVAYGALLQGGGPNPITDPDAWMRWLTADPIASFVGLLGAAMAGIGAVAGLMQVLGSKPQSRDEAARGHDRIRATVEDDGDATRQRLSAMEMRVMAQLSGLHAGGGPTDAATDRATAEAVRELVRDGDAAEQEAAHLIADGRIEEGFTRLRDDARARPNDRDAADKWRRLGAMAFGVNVTGARKAYEDALAIRRDLSAFDPKNTEWLHDLSIGHIKLGDVARAEGDLACARKAYEDGLVIARDLSSREPKNTGWLRDLAFSHAKLGDVVRAEGDLVGARKAYEDGLVIAGDLCACNPKNTEWLRDLSVSYDRLGDVARAEGDLAGARKAYEDGLAIRRDPRVRDPRNAEWRRGVWNSLWRLAGLPDGGVTWAQVRDAIAAEKGRGTLLKDDERFLAEAERCSAS